MIRRGLLIALALGMAAVMVTTWGSVGSILMCFGLLTMGSALLYQHFITHRDESDFQMEE